MLASCIQATHKGQQRRVEATGAKFDDGLLLRRLAYHCHLTAQPRERGWTMTLCTCGTGKWQALLAALPQSAKSRQQTPDMHREGHNSPGAVTQWSHSQQR